MNNEDVRENLDEIFSRGLRSGAGADEGGQVCVEQAIALVHGEGLTDSPSCVHPVVRAYSIRLNDASWSSPGARAAGLRDFAFAQLGTATGFNAVRFASKLAELTIMRVLPIALRAVGLSTYAERCEKEGTEGAARSAYDAAAYSAARSAAAAAYSAARSAYDAAYAAAAYSADVATAAAYDVAAYDVAAYAAYAADGVLRESAACAIEAIAYARV